MTDNDDNAADDDCDERAELSVGICLSGVCCVLLLLHADRGKAVQSCFIYVVL